MQMAVNQGYKLPGRHYKLALSGKILMLVYCSVVAL